MTRQHTASEDSRTRILDRIRTQRPGKTGQPLPGSALPEERLKTAAPNLVPARGQLEAAARTALFARMAREAAAKVTDLDSAEEIPAALARILEAESLPPSLRIAPAPRLQSLPWDHVPHLQVKAGIADPADMAGLSLAAAGIAETGTLVLASGPESPTSLNFLPETHLVVLFAADIRPAYEDFWHQLRQDAARQSGTSASNRLTPWSHPSPWPRMVNLITGPSRSADIEMTLLLGAHGPRRLHILLIK